MDFTKFNKPRAPIMLPIVPRVKDWDELVGLKFVKDKGMEAFEIAFLYGMASESKLHNMFMGGEDGATEIAKIVDNEIKGKDTISDDSKKTLVDSVDKSIGTDGAEIMPHVYNLCHAFKKQELDEGHLEGYFASLGTDGINVPKFASFMRQARPFLPNYEEEAGFSHVRLANSWMLYRENLVSWPSLYQKAHNVIGQFMSDDYTAAVGNDPSNMRGMKGNDMVILAAFLDANDQFPKHWYQGKKARDGCNPVTYAIYVDAFTKYQEILEKNNGLKDADNMDKWTKVASTIFQ